MNRETAIAFGAVAPDRLSFGSNDLLLFKDYEKKKNIYL